jgi:chromatin remodeling complex protein RSC6
MKEYFSDEAFKAREAKRELDKAAALVAAAAAEEHKVQHAVAPASLVLVAKAEEKEESIAESTEEDCAETDADGEETETDGEETESDEETETKDKVKAEPESEDEVDCIDIVD